MKRATVAEIAKIRTAIDAVDGKLIASLAERNRLVMKLLPFKTQSTVTDKERESVVLEKARKNSLRAGLNPVIAEAVFKTIIAQFTTAQKGYLKKNAAPDEILRH